MHRAVTALLGPTNTGKTHLAIERMLTHPTGMIGFPLRLLARENYDRVAALRGAGSVALVTGEERIVPPRPSYWMCTVEAMPLDLRTDFLAVDEVQLAADRERGHVFTDRIQNARGRLETWLIGADTIRSLLHRLLPGAASTTRPRLSTLSYSEPKPLGKLPRRSAVIVFSVRELYEVAARLRRERGGAALVFGALSPRTRNAQVALYQAGDVDHLVATDAIGMGLNLDIDYVVFTGLTKFDGVGPRTLTPAEVGQIAGRAGRHVRDGRFASTVELGPLDRRLVEAVEAHRFASLSHLYWRTDELDFFSPLALLGSLDRQPPHPFLVRMRHAEDQRALAALTRDAEVMALTRDPGTVRLLWEVCQVPDFQGVLSEAHTRLLARVYRFLRGPAGRIPEDFLASHVKDLDRAEGDVETLLGRIAAIRTWTYISNRASWVPDPRFWQERTRAVEDRLSDALHERLTQEFVDRAGHRDRAPRPVGSRDERGRGRRGARAGAAGRACSRGSASGPTARCARARGGCSPPRTGRSRASCASAWRPRARGGRRGFALGPGAEVLWRGAAVARLVAGESALSPQVEVLASDLLDPPLRERVRRRLAAWLEAHLRAAPSGRSSPCATAPRRGSSRARVRPGRGARRASPVAPWRSRSRPSRRTIGRRSPAWGSRSGASRSSSPPCSDPRPRGCGRASSPCARDGRPRAGPTARRPSRATPRHPPPSTWPAATCPPARARSASTGWSARPPSPPASPATGPSSPRGTSRRSSAAAPTRCRRC